MFTKEVVHTLKDDNKQELQKQLGCMNGIFQMFDFLGQRRHGHNQKRLTPGKRDNGEKELKNASEQAKEKALKIVMKERNKRVSVDLPRNSFSSSTSSTATSSLDHSKRVQTELSSSCQSVISEPSSSPFIYRKQPNLFMQSPDIRDVVKDSMTREPRVVSIKKVGKKERVGPAMKYVDSPRPYPHQKPVQYDENDRRFSCDGRESRQLLKSNTKVKELPRLSLDSRKGYIGNSANVVARLMGLEDLTDSIDESQTLKTKVQKGVRIRRVITRIPLETAPWKQEGGGRPQKPPYKSKESRSIYDEIEKRLTEHKFKTAGKDLRALEKILEAMQKTKKRLENKEHDLNNNTIDDRLSQRVDQPVSPTINGISPRNVKRLKDPTPRDTKSNGRPQSTSKFPEHSRTESPRMQRSQNRIHRSPSDLSRPKKQPNMQQAQKGSTTRNPKVKLMDPYNSQTRNSSQQSDTVSFQSDSYSMASQNDSEVTSTESVHEVNSPFRPKENNSNISERLTEEKSTVDHAKHTMEQPSPVSVLDAFYTEETPSPVKKKSNAFNDDDNLRFKETQDQYSKFNNAKLENINDLVRQIELLSTDTDDAKVTVSHTTTSPCEGETEDHRYKAEILYDEDDEVLNIIKADVNKRSQDWDDYCNDVPGLVLDIERMIFKDLINEVVNGQVTDVHDWPVGRRCRQLFPNIEAESC